MTITVILLVIIVLLLVILIYLSFSDKNKYEITEKIVDKNNEIKEGISKNLFNNQSEIIKELNLFKENANYTINNNMDNLIKKVEDKLDKSNNLDKNTQENINKFKEAIGLKLEESLKDGFKKSNETFTSVIERLSKIDEAQKNIDKLSKNILDLQRVLTDKKLRGNFGEIQLNQILYNVFGEEGELYKLQYIMENESKKVDAVVFCKDPMGLLPIDSKFPLENFNRIQEGIDARREFIADVKKHITDIYEKYVKLQGLNQAVMFIPSEAVYIYILANCPELIEFSYKNKIWIASSTTLMAILTTIQLSIINIQKNENAKELYKQLKDLSPEFRRYKERWDKLVKDIETIEKDVKNIAITSRNLGDKFDKINSAQ